MHPACLFDSAQVDIDLALSSDTLCGRAIETIYVLALKRTWIESDRVWNSLAYV